MQKACCNTVQDTEMCSTQLFVKNLKKCSYDFSLYNSLHETSPDTYIILKMFMIYSHDYNVPVSMNENA